VRVDPVSWWMSEFNSIAPVGHQLRERLHERWTRFHSLPESKRFAENEAEYGELLRRHVSVASELFEAGETIYVYRSHFGERRLKGRRRHQIAGRHLRETMAKLPTGLDEEGDHYYVRALATTWIPDFFGVLTRQVADWKEAGITFVSPCTKNVYAPYDGGMDIFAFSLSPRMLEEKFRSWMSSREDRK
jgi:hypothetical protein